MPRLARPEPRPAARIERPAAWRLLLRRQRWMLRPLAWGVIILCLGAAAGLMLRTVQPGSAVAQLRERLGAGSDLRVADVVVEGRSNTPEAALQRAIGVQRGDPLLGYSLEAARARIEALTWVQNASVERRLPGTIVVNLTERRPFAVWQTAGRFVLIDRAGQVVADQDPVKDQAAFGVLPLVVGPGAPEHAAELLDQLAQQPALKQRVAAAVRVGERRWNLRLNTGADVLLPEGAEAAAMARLMEIQSTQGVLDRPLQALDLRLPDRLTVRPAPAPAPAGPRRPT